MIASIHVARRFTVNIQNIGVGSVDQSWASSRIDSNGILRFGSRACRSTDGTSDRLTRLGFRLSLSFDAIIELQHNNSLFTFGGAGQRIKIQKTHNVRRSEFFHSEPHLTKFTNTTMAVTNPWSTTATSRKPLERVALWMGQRASSESRILPPRWHLVSRRTKNDAVSQPNICCGCSGAGR